VTEIRPEQRTKKLVEKAAILCNHIAEMRLCALLGLLVCLVVCVEGFSPNNNRGSARWVDVGLIKACGGVEPRSHAAAEKETLKQALSVSVAVATLLGRPRLTFGAMKQSKLDFDQKNIENRPSQTDGAVLFNGVLPDFSAVRRDIKELIEAKMDKGPTLVRLAWHSSGTYSKMNKDGGSQKGTIRFREELTHGANAGLDTAISWLEPLYKKYNRDSDLSYADLFTYAGVVAIEVLGGPKIPWRAGRVDSMDVTDVTPDGRLPDADKGNPAKTAAGLREVFGRMGFEDREIVALSGAHALGRCHPTASGYVGPWSFTPTQFNNQYYILLKGLKWSVDPKANKLQYTDPSGKLMMLPSDLVLIEDPSFKSYVDMYAKDNKLFFSDFSAAFAKLLELGTINLISV
jgi:cytochrome c peroxidase